MTTLQITENKFEITINPAERYQYNGKPRRYELFLTKMDELIRESLATYGISYRLYAEISTPHININATQSSSKPRLHLHGVIKFKEEKQKANFFLKSIYKISRWANLTYNNYRPEWEDYITKYNPLISLNPTKNAHIFRNNKPIKRY